MEKPGQAIPTEGFHEYSADVMYTSFFLLSYEDTDEREKKISQATIFLVINSLFADN
jgi:hypothetical protein